MKFLLSKSSLIVFLLIFQIYCQNKDSLFTAARIGRLQGDVVYTKTLVCHTLKEGSSKIKNHPGHMLVVSTGLILASMGDNETRRFFRNHRTKEASGFFNTINHLGQSKNMAAAIGGLYFTGWIIQKPKIRQVSLEMFTAYTISGLITTGFKHVSGRARPYLGREQYYFRGINEQKERYLSFPSGHATISFSTATVLAQHTESKWMKAGLYSMAGAISTGRMYKDQHWFTDVLTGGIIGYLTGKLVTTVSQQINLHRR